MPRRQAPGGIEAEQDALAERAGFTRYDDPRAWVKHAGLAPRANESGTFRGATRTTGRGGPRLRTAAWRAIRGARANGPRSIQTGTSCPCPDRGGLPRCD